MNDAMGWFLIVVYVLVIVLLLAYAAYNTTVTNEACEIDCDFRKSRIIDEECFCMTPDGSWQPIVEKED